ncbi:hypothetical protein KJY78_02750 [Canibacter sp. lx-45]|uniref:hypothetical protein n=1 Tax=Canibacter zhuwentaonis TaxID=2837491 RepID=UPI001BDBEFC4|nr:hypothetical protein [Canibacter zhuwentaonis]MBT1035274.1 hypothetical protein [Canibacter zhuwentaonis]
MDEQFLADQYPDVLRTLLLDRSAGRNILWATDDYKDLSQMHQGQAEITFAAITGEYAGVIAPRVDKPAKVQAERTKRKAEVFTPSWVCNLQNNLVDEVWFGRPDVFNRASEKTWVATTGKIDFSEESSRSWKVYVDENRLEITCGEAPYLVSRYDTTSGEKIPLGERIGLLDRKLRVVSENVDNEQEWLKWSQRAFEATYGFEYQGDSLLLARENLLASYGDYMLASLDRFPTAGELKRIAVILSWNLWQMDGLTGFPPYSDAAYYEQQQNTLDLFEIESSPLPVPCHIRDWRAKKTHTFNSLLSERRQK